MIYSLIVFQNELSITIHDGNEQREMDKLIQYLNCQTSIADFRFILGKSQFVMSISSLLFFFFFSFFSFLFFLFLFYIGFVTPSSNHSINVPYRYNFHCSFFFFLFILPYTLFLSVFV
eukprot:TRINITY_DN11243_c1_g1_i1.p1 TRINITY_DN11243_c1_g1~~TRINITY_DN11243_c1_g1_i1.p1  ORF type:complete len:118 (+),score=15.32 TRINITY_DN11243_c1_g1_i1:71-424(+)